MKTLLAALSLSLVLSSAAQATPPKKPAKTTAKKDELAPSNSDAPAMKGAKCAPWKRDNKTGQYSRTCTYTEQSFITKGGGV